MILPNALRLFILLLPLTSGVLRSATAHACSCTPNVTINQAVPADGATDVPVNVVPWVRSRALVKLLDPDGNVVEIVTERHTARSNLCIFTKDLRPVQPLKPNTTYRLKFEPDDITGQGTLTETTFTTGDATLASNDEFVELRSTVFDASQNLNTCILSKYQACIDSGIRDKLIDVRVFDGDEQMIHHVDFASNLRNLELGAGQDEGRADCLEVRARNLAGQTSAPARSCFDLGTVPLLHPALDPALFPDCEAMDFEERLEPKETGCALTRPRWTRGVSTSGVFALLVLGVVLVRRRANTLR